MLTDELATRIDRLKVADLADACRAVGFVPEMSSPELRRPGPICACAARRSRFAPSSARAPSTTAARSRTFTCRGSFAFRVLPTVLLFITLQKRFVEGINMTAGIK